MLVFEGTETFDRSADTIFSQLADAGWLALALPDSEVSEATSDHAVWKVRPKFTFMAGNLDTIAHVTERSPVDRVCYHITSKGVGSSSTVLASLNFIRHQDTTTQVVWVAELTELGGLLKMVPRGLLQATAQKVIDDVWASIRLKLTS